MEDLRLGKLEEGRGEERRGDDFRREVMEKVGVYN